MFAKKIESGQTYNFNRIMNKDKYLATRKAIRALGLTTETEALMGAFGVTWMTAFAMRAPNFKDFAEKDVMKRLERHKRYSGNTKLQKMLVKGSNLAI